MTRSTRYLSLGAAGLVVGLVAVGVVRWREPAAPVTVPAPPATATVARQTLVDVVTARGQLAYGPEFLAESRLPGTLTGMADIGATVCRGEALFRVDNRPVVLLYGELPAYRALVATPQTTGADVRQFEENLRALGYSGFTVDDEFTAQTAEAVRRWQKVLGLEPTGTVELGRVHYAPGPVRVAGHKLVAGQLSTGPVLALTGTVRLVTAGLKAHDRALAKPNAAVTVELPNGKRVSGAVRSVRSAPEAPAGGGDQEPLLDVVVAVTDPAQVDGLDDGPAVVRFVAEQRENVLVVPVAALLALAEGGYGLEVLDGGEARIVAVTTGLFADGSVEVSGPDVAEGLTVGMAR